LNWLYLISLVALPVESMESLEKTEMMILPAVGRSGTPKWLLPPELI